MHQISMQNQRLGNKNLAGIFPKRPKSASATDEKRVHVAVLTLNNFLKTILPPNFEICLSIRNHPDTRVICDV